MLKKIRNLEKRFYEIIGIRTFKKMAFALVKFLSLPILLCLSEDERHIFLNAPSNYNMKKGHGIKDLKDFKKMLLFNATIHTWGLYKCIPGMKMVFMGSFTVAESILMVIPTLINLYCVMLQRYNLIRIHEAEEKHERYQELKKKRQKKLAEEKGREQENKLSLEELARLQSLLKMDNSNVRKVVDARPFFNNTKTSEPLSPDFWLNSSENVKVLKRKIG